MTSELRRCSDSSEALARCSVFTLWVCFRPLVFSDLELIFDLGICSFFFFFGVFVGWYLCNLLGLVLLQFFFFSDFSSKFFLGFFLFLESRTNKFYFIF